MADSKISQLTALTAANVAGADVLPIVDTSATTTKKVSTADLAEYVSTSTAITNLLSPKAPLASPTFTGTPAAPTAAADTNTTQIATTAYVVGQGYAKLASPTFTGTPAAPTAADGTNTTQVATTAFVQAQSQVDQFILASAIF